MSYWLASLTKVLENQSLSCLVELSYVLMDIGHTQYFMRSRFKEFYIYVLNSSFLKIVESLLRRSYFKYSKISNISPWLIDIFKHMFWDLNLRGLIFGGANIRRAFCVSINVFKSLKSITVFIKHIYHRQKRAFFELKSP